MAGSNTLQAYTLPNNTSKTARAGQAGALQATLMKEGNGIYLSGKQANEFIRGLKQDGVDEYISQVAALPAFFDELQRQDPDGLYIFEDVAPTYEFVGMGDRNECRELYRITVITSSMKRMAHASNGIFFMDAAFLHSKFLGSFAATTFRTGDSTNIPWQGTWFTGETASNWQFHNVAGDTACPARMKMADRSKGLETIRSSANADAANAARRAAPAAATPDAAPAATPYVFAACCLYIGKNGGTQSAEGKAAMTALPRILHSSTPRNS